MALVAYDNSDSSDYEEVDKDSVTVATLDKESNGTRSVSPPLDVSTPKEAAVSPENGPSLFNLLPQPAVKKSVVEEEDDEFLHKKEDISAVKPKAKITVPSLRDFKDVQSSTPNIKPKTTNEKKCGLLSILPQPRNVVTITSKSFIPNSLMKKADVKKKELPPTGLKSKIDPKPVINDYSDDSENEEVENDFFSINKQVVLPEVPLDLEPTNDENKTNTQKKPFSIESYFKADDEMEEDTFSVSSVETEASSSNGYIDPENVDNSVLDDEAILKLVGARGKRKREEIHLVDFDQAEVLRNAKEMLMKGLMDNTTKRVSASKKKGNDFTHVQKRKHQITYLAFQAKANEAELQNQWANNRMSRRQTQSKYGF